VIQYLGKLGTFALDAAAYLKQGLRCLFKEKKMVSKKKGLGVLAMVLVFGMTVAGCDIFTNNNNNNNDDDDYDQDPLAGLAKIDLVGAASLFIAPASARGARNANDRLFKITDEGAVLEVAYEDDDGNPMTVTQAPSSITVLNDDFVVIDFGIPGNAHQNIFLVNSRTGAAYIFPIGIVDNATLNVGMYAGERIAHDDKGNIYFIGNTVGESRAVLIRLAITDPEKVTTTIVTVPGDGVSSFAVDKDGNVAYNGHNSNNNWLARFRYFNGDLEMLSTRDGGFTFWTGFNGKLYYFDFTDTITGTSDSSVIKEILTEPFSVVGYGNNDWKEQVYNGYSTYRGFLRIKTPKRIIAYLQDNMVEVYNEQKNNATAIPLSTFGLASIKLAAVSDDHYFLTGASNSGTASRNVLVKVDPLDNSYVTLLDGGYDISTMTVGSDGSVTFNALRLSPYGQVMGTVSSPDDLKILDVALGSEVTVLERIR